MRLSGADFSFIREMRSAGVFEDAVPDKLQKIPRLVVCQCGDGHRFRDWFEHLSHSLYYDAELIHPVTLNGGALTLSPSSPLANRSGLPHDMVCLANIKEGCAIKETGVVLLGVHFPCGMASTFGVTPRKVLEHFVEAKSRLRTSIMGAQPIMLVHVDYDGYETHVQGRFRTYFFNRKAFEAWQSRHLEHATV